MDFNGEGSALRALINSELGKFFADETPQSGLFEAMRYSLMAGGKRIRPILVLKFCEAAGGKIEDALPYACAIEMIHTYSLIHDDLPCMDNDDLRRGKPTCHKVFGEGVAALAGDALQAAAFRTVLDAQSPADIRAAAGAVLARAAGELGMCGGQYLDLGNNAGQNTEEDLTVINDLKTGAIITAACEMGVIAAGCADDGKKREAARSYGLNLARAFQIRDDVLDIISDEETFGKPIGSDAENEKTTYASLLGIERCGELINEYTEYAVKAVADNFENRDFLALLAEGLKNREF